MLVKRGQNGPEIKFFDFLNYPKYCNRYFATNPVSGKTLVLELWIKMFLANQIAEFFKM